WGAIVVAVLALVDAATGWNLWNNGEYGEGTATRRVVSTLGSLGVLGAYIGAGVVFSVAILVWKGSCLLWLSVILLFLVSIPALFFTYSRGPVLRTAMVAIFITLITNRAHLPNLLILTT